MIRFECDYGEGCHPAILQRMLETNMEQTPGYGQDIHCQQAAALIKQFCGSDAIDVHFLVGGTQANTTVIASVLRPHQGVIAAVTGHINAHETGAIEATGHKVLPLPSADGKITAAQVAEYCRAHWEDSTFEHMVQPGMVYISQPTENGTLYSKEELQQLHAVCRQYHLPLFLDGARLGYGLASPANDASIQDIVSCCDVFYIGGTKVGALFGEAVVIVQDELKKDFRYHIKQHGGMLAKGRLLGIQFETLFQDQLYLQISRHAVDLALQIKQAFAEKQIPFLYDSDTNQQFPILEDQQLAKLQETYAVSVWSKTDATHTAVRFCTSWATDPAAVKQLITDIQAL